MILSIENFLIKKQQQNNPIYLIQGSNKRCKSIHDLNNETKDIPNIKTILDGGIQTTLNYLMQNSNLNSDDVNFI